MKKLLHHFNRFGRILALTLLIFSISSDLKAQNRIIGPDGPSYRYKDAVQNNNSFGNLKTAATATCPTNPVTLVCQDSTNIVNGTATTIASGSTLACNNQSIVIYSNGGTTTNENTPCVSTLYSTYYTNIRNQITESFYEGGTNIGCVGPSAACSFPIGGTPNLSINGVSSWSVLLGYLDPSQQHDFTFCRGAGTITTTSVSLVDCWTGAVLAGPQQLSTASTAPCFTMTLPANTPIGSTSWSIAPASAASSLIDYGFGEAQIKTYMLSAGTYTVTYSFTPPPSSGCGTVTGTYKFTVGPNPTVAVTSPTACSGNTATLTASGTSTSFSWAPSAGLSSTTGTTVTYNGTTSTTYTVTGMKGGCSATATSTVTINPTPTVTVNSATVCTGGTATLTANGATTYSWTPATGLSATTGSMVTATPTTTPMVYTVTGTSTGCSSSATSTVTVSPSATITATSATVCPGGTGTLTASGANTYTWTPTTGLSPTTGSSVQANPASTTVYTITGSDAASCAAIPGTATLTVSAIGSLVVSNDTAICPSTSATLTVSGATTYSWTPSTGLSTTTGSTVVASPTAATSYTITGTTGGCTSQGVINVSINATPTVSVNSASICLGDSATLKATGATTYSWASATGLNTTFGDSVKASPATTTIYTVTGTALGCSSTATATVTIVSSPTISVSASPTSVCTGGSTTLTATGATTYTWTADPTLSTTTGSVTVSTPTANPTSYTVSGSVGTCSAVPGVISVSITPTPTLTVSNDTAICAGSTVTLTASGATSYVWGTSTVTPIGSSASVAVTPTASQTYYVIGNPSSCRVLDSVKVTVNATPTVTASSNPTAICAGQQTATLTASGASTYTWNPSGTLSAATGSVVTTNNTLSTSTNYTVSGTDASGCKSSGTVNLTVNQPSPISVASTSICIGGTATLTATGANTTYTWSTGTNGATITPSPTVTTSYTVAGMDANTCASFTTTTVTVNNLPTITATSGTACVNSSTSLTASGANTYTWNPTTNLSSPNGTPVNVTPNTAGTITYTVSGTDGNNCVNTATATVLANPKPIISATVDASTICKGSSVNLSATGAINYTWTPSVNLTGANTANPTGTPLANTTYTVKGTDANGCVNTFVVPTVSVSIINPAITADPTTGDAPLTVVFTNNSTGATTYTWNYGNGSATQVTTNSTTQSIYQAAGTYTVTMIAANATCQALPVSVIIIVNEGFSISIPNIFTPNGDGINDNFFVKSSGVKTMDIMVLDRWGLKIWEGSSVNSTWDGRNGSKEANDGTYFYIIKVTDTKGVSTDYKGPLTLIR